MAQHRAGDPGRTRGRHRVGAGRALHASTSPTPRAAVEDRPTTASPSSRSSTTSRRSSWATSPSTRRIPRRIWVGTGENNSSRSSYGGMGVFRSDDGGETWSLGASARATASDASWSTRATATASTSASGQALHARRRARRLPHHRRRRDLDAGARPRRRDDRLHRPGDGPGESRRALRRRLGALAPSLGLRRGRRRQRHLEDDRRRRHLDAARRRLPAGRARRPHRPGDLGAEPRTTSTPRSTTRRSCPRSSGTWATARQRQAPAQDDQGGVPGPGPRGHRGLHPRQRPRHRASTPRS